MTMWCTCGDHSLNLVLHFYATMPRFVGASDVAVESPRHGMVGGFSNGLMNLLTSATCL